MATTTTSSSSSLPLPSSSSSSSLAAAFLSTTNAIYCGGMVPSPVLGNVDAANAMVVQQHQHQPHQQYQQMHPQQQQQQQHLFPGQDHVQFAYPAHAHYPQISQHPEHHATQQQASQQHLQQQQVYHHQQQQQIYTAQDGPFRIPLPPRQFSGPTPPEPQPALPLEHAAFPVEDKNRLAIQRTQSLNSLYQPLPNTHHHIYAHAPVHPASFAQPFGGNLPGYTSSSVSDLSGFASSSSSSSSSLFRYASYGMASEHKSHVSDGSAIAGSSRGGMAAPAQADIDQLLAMSKAQAEVAGDANMFACPHCDKTYTGRHARSIWRRHLQDKHNIPLSIQPRRTRWDGDANRPKNAEERRARMLESKRRWARKKRQQEKLGLEKSPDGDDDTTGDAGYDDGADADVSTMAGGDESTFSKDEDKKENFSPSQPPGVQQQQQQHPTNGPGDGFWPGAPETKLAHANWPSPSRRVSEPNPFFAHVGSGGIPHYDYQAAPVTGSLTGASTTPLNRNAHLYPTPPSSGHPQLDPAGFPSLHLYSSSPMRKVASAALSSNAEAKSASDVLPLLSPPASDERSTAIVYQQRMRISAAGMDGGFEASSDGYLAPSGGAIANGLGRGSSDSVAATSVATPTSATFFPGVPADVASSRLPQQATLPVRKTDQQEAAIQLLALRSHSNSPTDSDPQASRKRRHASMDEPWDTPSKTLISPSDARLQADSGRGRTRPSPSPRSKSSTNVPVMRAADLLDDGPDAIEPMGAPRRRSESRDSPFKTVNTRISVRRAGEGSPSPATRTKAPPTPMGSGVASSSAALLSLSTPGPASRTGSNPFLLNKHKISPFEGKRRLSFTSKDKLYDAFGGELGASPVASPIRVGGPLGLPALGLGGTAMEKSTSAQSAASDTSVLGPRLPPLVSTPIRPNDGLSAIRGTAKTMYDDDIGFGPLLLGGVGVGGGRGKLGRDILPPPLSTSKRAAIVSTPFSKGSMASGLSVMRLGASALKSAGAPGSISRPTPSKVGGGDQFSSPQHLNLTESLGLAPHSISRSSYASLYGGSLGLTPSISALGGLTPGLTGFNTPFGAWPESARKGLAAAAAADDDDDDEDLENKPRGNLGAGLDGKSRRAVRGLGHDETPSKPSNPQRRKLQSLSLSLAGNLDG